MSYQRYIEADWSDSTFDHDDRKLLRQIAVVMVLLVEAVVAGQTSIDNAVQSFGDFLTHVNDVGADILAQIAKLPQSSQDQLDTSKLDDLVNTVLPQAQTALDSADAAVDNAASGAVTPGTGPDPVPSA